MSSIKKKKDFERLRESGRFLHVTHWLAVSFSENGEGKLRWGWTVPKKVGTAVVRNRLKRWGREQIKSYKGHEIDINFIFKIKKSEFYRSLTRTDFNAALERAFQKVAEHGG